MMRIRSAFFIMIFSIFTTASYAFAAGVVGTPHDVTNAFNNIGTCSVCHIPHKAHGSRVWPTPDRGIGEEGEAGNLCLTCHSSNGYGSTIFIEASFAEKYVFPGFSTGKESHGLKIDNPYKEGTLKGEELLFKNKDSYKTGAGANMIQCTTCHNVHVNENFRPFLRDSIKDLCVKCHQMSDSHWDESEIKVYFDNDTGLPFVNWLRIGEGVISFTIQAFDDPFGVTDMTVKDNKGRWNLGRHLGSDVEKIANTSYTPTTYSIKNGVPGNGLEGGIICVTCHAVHGVQDDSNANTPIEIPRKNLLPSLITGGDE